MPVTKHCEHCKKQYSKPPSIAARSRFCSAACRSASDRTAERRLLTCTTCGTGFEAKQDHGVWPRFCSRACFSAGAIKPVIKSCGACDAQFLAEKSNTANSEDGRRLYCSRACADAGKRVTENQDCACCGNEFRPHRSDGQLCCSKKCAAAYFVGSRNHNFRGGVWVHSQGAKMVALQQPGHVSKGMFIHRIVAAREIGRLLTKDEHVIFVNGDKLDTRPENLFICESLSECRRRWEGSLPWPEAGNLMEFAQKAL